MKRWKSVVFIFILALTLRLAMIVVWQASGLGNRVAGDGADYYEIARNLAAGKGFQLIGEPTRRRGPLYPFFIAGVGNLAPFPVGVQVAQALLGALSCVLLFLLGEKIFGPPMGLLASGIYSLDYLAIRQTVSLMPEILFVFFTLLSTLFVMQAPPKNSLKNLFLSGIFAGLASLTKEVLIFYFLLLSFWLVSFSGSWKNRILRGVVFLFGLSLVAAPWMVRNRLVFGEWGLGTSSMGHSFYLGNNPLISGRVVGEEWEYEGDSGFPQHDPHLPPLFTNDADRYLLKQGFQYVQTHPGNFFEMSAKKFLRFWYPYYLGSPPLAKALTVLSYLPVLILGILGIFWSSDRWKELIPLFGPILYLTLVCTLTISSIRYRYPAIPLLTLFAAFALYKMGPEKIKLRSPKTRIFQTSKA